MRQLSAWNALQARWLTKIQVDDLTFNGSARSAGINPPGFRKWFRVKDSTTSPDTLQKMAEALDIPFDKALKEAGGKTRDDVWAEAGSRGAARLTSLAPEVIAVRQKRSAQSRRGRKLGPGVWDKIQEGRQRTGANERSRAGLATDAQSLNGRTRRSLFARLIFAPAPKRERIREWAGLTSTKLGLPPAAVLAIWRPHLQARGLLHAGGRRRMDARFALVKELRQTGRRVGTSQRQAALFWGEAAGHVSAAEKKEIAGPALKQRWYFYTGRLADRPG